LHAIEKIHKKGIWLPHELSENAILSLSIAIACQAKKKEFFVAHRDWR